MRHLRSAKQEIALLVALADLGGVWTTQEVMTALTRAADVFAVKIAQSGGLVGAAHVAAIASAANIDLYGGTMLEGAVGTIASAQLFSTFGELKWGTELFGPLLLTEEILIEPLRYENFALHLPQGPGLGITLDWDKIDRLRRDTRKGASVTTN